MQLKKVQIILYRNPHNPEYLLLRTHPRRGKSIWQGVTGGIESEDVSIKAGAVRELQEEIGIAADEKNLIGPLYEFQFETNRTGYEGSTATEYCFGYELQDGEEPRLSEEHIEFVWLPYKKVLERIDYDSAKHVLELINERLQK